MSEEVVLVALTGPPGSGKSTVAELLRQQGIPVLQADAIVHELLATDPEVRQQLRERFGAELFDSNDRVQTELLAERIFGPTVRHRQNREFVEELLHPKVLQRLSDGIEELVRSGERLIVVEIPLLYEVGLEEAFDYVVLVDAPLAERRRRLAERGWSWQQLRARMAAQLPVQQKRQQADFVLDNSGTLEELRSSVAFLAELLRALPSRIALAKARDAS